MPTSSPKLEWCSVRLGEDMNWWVDEISDDIHWDLDGLSIIDPRQMSHIIDLIDALRDYDFLDDILETAFFKFRIEKKLDNNRLHLVRVNESILEADEMLFSLPDIIDEEKGPYADFIDHITRLRVKLLNDSIEFEKKLTVEELEEEIREEQNNNFMEGRATHIFQEIIAILEYIPTGYELEMDEDKADKPTDEDIEDFPDLVDDENLVEDETMKWDEDEEEEESDDFEEDADSSEENADEDEDSEEESSSSRRN